jgi:hypothetical protein
MLVVWWLLLQVVEGKEMLSPKTDVEKELLKKVLTFLSYLFIYLKRIKEHF